MKFCEKNIFILLAAFNGATYIRKQLKTILNQTFKPSKILINIDKIDGVLPKNKLKIYPVVNIIDLNKV